jgi:hypothetical protein
MTMGIKFDNSTATYAYVKTLNPYTLAVFEPGILC